MTSGNTLVKKVFPELRRICRDRGGEFTEVDLRWGITEEDARKGKVVEVCLQEIDRCRPYFIGILGNRYGWIPGPEDLNIDDKLEDKYKDIIKEGMEKGLSVTELEIIHGALNNPEMAGKVFFYFLDRDEDGYNDDLDEDKESRLKLEGLKERIRGSGMPVKEGIKDINKLGEEVKKDLLEVIDDKFPPDEILTPLEKERIAHSSFASTRLIGYEENTDNLAPLYDHVESENQPLVVYGDTGTGKSALLAYWSKKYKEKHPDAFIIEHYIGASDKGSNHLGIIKRIMEEIKERYNLTDEIPANPRELERGLYQWLAKVRNEKLILIIDALNQLEEVSQDLTWLPRHLPQNVRTIVSTTTDSKHRLEGRGWPEFEILLLDNTQRVEIIKNYLRKFTKKLSKKQQRLILDNENSYNPLFLRVVLEELRIHGEFESLDEKIKYYMKAWGLTDLFERVLERLEKDYGREIVREVLTLVEASRKGLSEIELRDITGFKHFELTQFISAMDFYFCKKQGLYNFFHNDMSRAVCFRYIEGYFDEEWSKHNGDNMSFEESQHLWDKLVSDVRELRAASHLKIADYFEKHNTSIRKIEELPFQLYEAEALERLKNCLTDINIFKHTFEMNRYELIRYWIKLRERYDIVKSYKECIEVYEMTNPEREALSNVLGLVGSFLVSMALYEGAEYFLKRSLGLKRKTLGEEHLETINGICDLAFIYLVQGKNDAAEAYFSRALELSEIIMESDDRELIPILVGQGELYASKEEYYKAELLYTRAIRISEEKYGIEHKQTVTIYCKLAELHTGKGEYDKAEALFEKALGISEKILGEQAIETIQILSGFGKLYTARGEYEKAEILYLKALENSEDLLTKEHSYIVVVLKKLGELYILKKEYDRARRFYKRALKVSDNALNEEQKKITGIVGVLTALGDLAVIKKNFAEGENFYKRALRECEELYRGEGIDTDAILKKLLALYSTEEEYEYANGSYCIVTEKREKGFEEERFNSVREEILKNRTCGQKIIDLKKIEAEGSVAEKGQDIREILDRYVRGLGYKELGERWIEIDKIYAMEILTFILTRDLAYNGRVMKDSKAREIVYSFINLFGNKIRFFTNSSYNLEEYRLESWNEITEATFDSGIIAIDNNYIGIIWMMDED